VGTTVKVYLPRCGAGVTEDEVITSATCNGGMQSEVIMVVEDEERVRAMAVEALRELGYSVIKMRGPNQALEAIRNGRTPALLFTDVIMPEMSGRELAEQVKALKPEMKILFTTGYARNAIIHNEKLHLGMSLLPKPYTIEQLADKIRAVLDG
jgi:CheY-like chemotaxis protein